MAPLIRALQLSERSFLENESLKELKNETLMWKSKAIISIGLKIDPIIRSNVQCSVDPQIALFVVRDAHSAEEKEVNANGLISEQYNIGRGSGVVLDEDQQEELMDYQAYSDSRMRNVVEDVDWSGTADMLVSEWNTPFDKFVMKASDDEIVIPMARILSTALSSFLAATTASPLTKRLRFDEEVFRSTRRRLQSFVRKFEIRLDPADIRALVIQGCLTEYEWKLPSLNTSAPDPNRSTGAALPIADFWGFKSAPPPSPLCVDSLPATDTSPPTASPLSPVS